ELPQLPCQRCGKKGLEQRDEPIEEELDPEEWGEARRCAVCRAAIHSDRLEILPDTQLCAACAAAGKTPEADEREFCPRCGAELHVATSGAGGLARYAMRC